MGLLDDVISGAEDTAEDTADAAGDAASGASATADKWWQSGTDTASDATSSASSAVDDFTSSASGAATSAVDDTVSGAGDLAGATGGFLGDVTGASKWAKSDDAASLRADMADNQDGTVKGALQDFDTAARAGFDFALDNPNASAQEGLKEAMKAPTEFATGEQVSDEELGQAFKSAAGKTEDAVQGAVEGTPLDNPVTDAAKGAMDVFVADPAKAALRGTTGVSIDSGGTEGTVGAVDAFDVGVTVGTAGVGGAAASALKGADEGAAVTDEAGGFLSRVMGQGTDEGAAAADDAASATASGADDAPQVMTDGGMDVFNPRNLPVVPDDAKSVSSVVDEATGASDEQVRAAVNAAESTDEAAAATDDAIQVESRVVDEAAGTTDEAAAATDDATEAGVLRGLGVTGAGLADEAGGLVDEATTRLDDFTARFTDEAAAGGDEAAGATDDAATLSDDAAAGTDEAATGADDAATLSDEAAQAGEESPGLLRRFLGTTTGKVATVGAGALGGGALLDALGTFDRLKLTDPKTGDTFVLIRTKSYQPTTKHQNGGTLWNVKTGNEQDGFTKSKGYTVIVGASGRNVYILDGNGNRTRAQVPPETFQKAIQRAKGAGSGGASA